MRGKGKAPVRELASDSKYGSTNVTKFINYVMEGGKKSTAEKVVYDAFDIINQKTKKDPLEIFDAAVSNVAPEVEVKSRRVGGANYQIPMAVMGNRRTALAYRWLLEAARARKGVPMGQKLAAELMDAANSAGSAFKKREDTYKMAEANRAFAHFAR
ncbi:30S ribosomal protein S7 [bacterium]|nr:30S ribosomal protein S7 [bacterium]